MLILLPIYNRFVSPAAAVVPGLLDAMAVAEGDGDAEGHETWRRRLFNYLDKVFTVRELNSRVQCFLAAGIHGHEHSSNYLPERDRPCRSQPHTTWHALHAKRLQAGL